MDREVLVYVDLQGTPHLVGRLWARTRRDRENATFEYDKSWLAQHRAVFAGTGIETWARSFSYAFRQASLWCYRRLCSRPMGPRPDAPRRAASCGARGADSADRAGDRLPAAGR